LDEKIANPKWHKVVCYGLSLDFSQGTNYYTKSHHDTELEELLQIIQN
jgi:hypothetical protein